MTKTRNMTTKKFMKGIILIWRYIGLQKKPVCLFAYLFTFPELLQYVHLYCQVTLDELPITTAV